MAANDVVRTDTAPRPVGAYPHARRVGDLLLLSGIGPRDPATNAVPGNEHDAVGKLVAHDIAAQTRAVFAYNHSASYVTTVLTLAATYAGSAPPVVSTPSPEDPPYGGVEPYAGGVEPYAGGPSPEVLSSKPPSSGSQPAM